MRLFFAATLLFVAVVCRSAEAETRCRVEKEAYGTTSRGEQVDLYTLTNANGIEVRIMALGATLMTVKTPDREGRVAVITLHKKTFAEYAKGHPLLGSVVGRYANRIAGARFTIDDVVYDVTRNAGEHHIHGGGRKDGFAWQVWRGTPVSEPGVAGVALSLVSPDGQAGFPGRLEVTMVYKLTADDRLIMDYRAMTDRATHVNLTNHAYWNLAGADSQTDISGHRLTLNAAQYLPADKVKMPTGEIADVDGTAMDFREPRMIGLRAKDTDYGYYDHCYVLTTSSRERLAFCARVEEPVSGRVMTVHTSQPGVQLYTGRRTGLCLETQHYPNAPNVPSFPSTLLRPGERFHQVTVHRFETASR
jgi:aldose 1-epimerase